MSFVVPNDPWLLVAVSTVFSMACFVMIALVLKRFLRKLDGKTTSSGRISNEKLELDIEEILSEIVDINRKLAEPAKRDFVVPEPDPLADMSKEVIQLWVDNGLLGADGKGSKEQIDVLKNLGLLLQKQPELELKPKKKKEPEKQPEPKPETSESTEQKSRDESKESGSGIMEGLKRLVTD